MSKLSKYGFHIAITLSFFIWIIFLILLLYQRSVVEIGQQRYETFSQQKLFQTEANEFGVPSEIAKNGILSISLEAMEERSHSQLITITLLEISLPPLDDSKKTCLESIIVRKRNPYKTAWPDNQNQYYSDVGIVGDNAVVTFVVPLKDACQTSTTEMSVISLSDLELKYDNQTIPALNFFASTQRSQFFYPFDKHYGLLEFSAIQSRTITDKRQISSEVVVSVTVGVSKSNPNLNVTGSRRTNAPDHVTVSIERPLFIRAYIILILMLIVISIGGILFVKDLGASLQVAVAIFIGVWGFQQTFTSDNGGELALLEMIFLILYALLFLVIFYRSLFQYSRVKLAKEESLSTLRDTKKTHQNDEQEYKNYVEVNENSKKFNLKNVVLLAIGSLFSLWYLFGRKRT